MLSRVQSIAREVYRDMVQIRRHLHMHPELSFHEDETASYIAETLERLRIPYRAGIGGRGLVAVVSGRLAGPNIAFRADFDALPIEETTGLSYASKNPGVMHACGHDMHTAILLGLGASLIRNPELVRGSVTLIFQDAEEQTPGGAAAMIKAGAINKAGRIYGLHVDGSLDTGTVGVCTGAVMAAADGFTVRFDGISGHGSRPHLCSDPISAAAAAVPLINAICAREVDAAERAVCTVCELHAGTSYNVTPDTAILRGTVRTFSPVVQYAIEEAIARTADGVARTFGLRGMVDYRKGYPAVINHEAEADTVRRAVKALGTRPLEEIAPSMVGEDFAYYLNSIPGCYMRLGVRGGAQTGDLHQSGFNPDEEALQAGLEVFLAIYLAETAQLHTQERFTINA